MDVGLVGLGWYHRAAHAPALLGTRCASLCRVHSAVVRTSSAAADALDAQLYLDERRDIVRHESFEIMLSAMGDASVDTVILALPIDVQPVVLRAAFEADRAAGRAVHVLSEKPIAPSLREGLALWRAYAAACARATARRAPPPLWAVLENWQCKPAAVHLVKSVRRGVIGAVHSFALCRFVDARGDGGGGRGAAARPATWRDDAARYPGWIIDVGVHYVRLLRNLFGEVARVGATAAHGASARSAQRVHGWLEFERGARGTLALAWDCAAVRAGRDADLTLWGERGTLRWYIGANRVTISTSSGESGGGGGGGPKAKKGKGDGGSAKTVTKGFERDKWISGGVEEALALALAVAAKRTRAAGGKSAAAAPALAPFEAAPFVLDPREALRDLAVADAINRSIDGNGAVVVPWPRAAATPGPAPVLAGQPLERYVALALPPPCGAALDPMALLSARDFRAANATAIVLARSLDDVAGALGWCAAQRGACGVRALGARHSLGWAPRGFRGVAGRRTLLVDVRGLDSPFELSSATEARPFATVTVSAGASLRALVAWLHSEHRLTLPSLPVLLDQTVGGGVATGTHGSSLCYGTLSDAVVAVTLATGSAVAAAESESGRSATQTLHLDEFGDASCGADADADAAAGGAGGGVDAVARVAAAARRRQTLRAARCSVGALGVVTRLTLKLVPSYRVRRNVSAVRFADFLRPSKHLPLIREGCTHAWVKWRLGDPFVGVCRLTSVRDEESGARFYAGNNWFPFDPPRDDGTFEFNNDVKVVVEAGTSAKAESGAPPPPPVAAAAAAAAAPATAAVPDEAPPLPRDLCHVSMQYSLPLHRLASAMKVLQAVAPQLSGGAESSAASDSGATRGARLRDVATVEIKFLRSSARTYVAANSVVHESALAVGDDVVPSGRCADADPFLASAPGAQGRGGWACFNVWWAVAPARRATALAPLETAMRTLCGARPHFGKQYCVGSIGSDASDGGGLSAGGAEEGGMNLNQFDGAWALEQREQFGAAIARCDPLGLFATSD